MVNSSRKNLLIVTLSILSILLPLSRETYLIYAQQPNSPDIVDIWEPLLRPNENCQLPCWWGIHPGISSEIEVMAILNNIFTEARITPTMNNEINRRQTRASTFRFDGYPDVVSPVSVSVTYDDNETVEYISLRSGDRHTFGVETQLAWSYFDIRVTLGQYGTPSSIELFAWKPAPEWGVVIDHLWLYWDALGLAIEYNACRGACDNNEPEHGEPVCYNLEEIAGLHLFLLSPESQLTLYDITQYWIRQSRPLQDVSDLTNAEFVQILLNNNGCVPADIPIDPDR